MDKLGDKIEDLEDKTKDFAKSTFNLSSEEKMELTDRTLELRKQIMEGKRTFTETEVADFGEDVKNKYLTRRGS
jgi:hypothetical protein